jgi:BirA family biotin operon repressor/biotin-[acetyl-CoA-carboxylase] ligase
MQFEITRHEAVTSTMDLARAQAEQGAPEGTVIVADEQTAGRGRGDHAWFSPPAQSLYLSIILRPTLAPAHAGWVTMVTALAVVDTLQEAEKQRAGAGEPGSRAANVAAPTHPLTPSPLLSIKWFNDVLINRRKACGILVEVSTEGDLLQSMIVGIGLNVNTRFDTAPPDVQARATSMAREFGFELDREEVLRQLLARLDVRYGALMQQNASPAAEYARHLSTLGRQVRVNTGPEIIAGLATRIEENGALVVQTPSGELRVGFGEVN